MRTLRSLIVGLEIGKQSCKDALFDNREPWKCLNLHLLFTPEARNCEFDTSHPSQERNVGSVSESSRPPPAPFFRYLAGW